MRLGLVTALHEFVVEAAPLVTTVRLDLAWPFGLPEEHLWPVPHDFRFDFSLPGGEWIDELASRARARLRRPAGELVIGHTDWRVENIRMDGDRVVAIFDWDRRQPRGATRSVFNNGFRSAARTTSITLQRKGRPRGGSMLRDAPARWCPGRGGPCLRVRSTRS